MCEWYVCRVDCWLLTANSSTKRNVTTVRSVKGGYRHGGEYFSSNVSILYRAIVLHGNSREQTVV